MGKPKLPRMVSTALVANAAMVVVEVDEEQVSPWRMEVAMLVSPV